MDDVETPKRKLWIVLSRPDRLPAAIAAAQGLREKFSGGVHLIHEQTGWWDCARWQPYAPQFEGVHAFPRVPTCRGLLDVTRLYRDTVNRRDALAGLALDPRCDILLLLGGFLTIANAAISAHPSVRKILAVAGKTYGDLSETAGRARFRFTTSGWLQNRIVEPLARINRTQNFKPRFNPGGDGVRITRFQKNPEEIFDAIVLLSNTGSEMSDRAFSLSARFPSCTELKNLPSWKSKNPRKKARVIFFGTPFLFIKNLPPEKYVSQLNACLDYIRRNFAENDLIYRPHPAESDEASRLQLEQFRLEDDRETAELYFLHYCEEIAAVFSVSSTVSRTALNNGINAYAMYPVFPFPKRQAEFFGRVMGDVPAAFAIQDLDKPPISYQPLPAGGHSFSRALNYAVASLEKV